jgi:hypothetical protein
MAKLNWFFDFHSQIEVHIGRRPRVQEIADSLADAGVREMTMFAKGHCGFTYYPTDLPRCYRHPKMVGDPLGDVVHACTRRGLVTLAYISFGIDGHGTRLNPLWARCNAELVPSYSQHHFIHTCPYTPYTQESVLPQIDEVLRRYPVSGLYFDTMGALSPCYCSFCLREFRGQFGFDPPRRSADLHWSEFGQWRRRRGMALLGMISQFIQERRPGAVVAFNQIGCPPVPEPMPPGCTRLSLDFTTSGTQSRQASRCTAYGSTAPLPADVMPTIFTGGWGDWSPAPAERHHQIAAAIWARNGTAYFGDRLHPDVKLAKPSFAALKAVAGFKRQYEQHAPEPAAKLAPDVIILHALSMQYSADYSTFCINEVGRLKTLAGATDLLLDAGLNYSVTAEHCLGDNLQGVSAVVIPQTEALTTSAEAQLRQFVEDGGQLLIVGRVPRVEGKPLAWAGVEDEPAVWQDHLYLPGNDAARLPEPVLVRGKHHRVRALPGAQVLEQAIAPVDMRAGISMGWGIAPPCDEPSNSPILCRTPLGTRGGAVWVLSAELFTSYQAHGYWQQVYYAAALMRQIVPRPALRLDSPHGQVEAVLHRHGPTCWVNLVNHGGETYADGLKAWPRTWGPLPIYRVHVELAAPSDRPPQSVSLRGQAITGEFSAQTRLLSVPVAVELPIQTLRVDW